MGGGGAQRGDAGGLLRAVGTWWLCADRVGDGGPGVELAEGAAAWVPHARVVFDRFHVERLAADAVDEVRRSEQRRLASEPEDAKALKGTRYALLKHPARLRPGEARRLETLRRKNRALDRAYELKEYLATILGQATPEDAPALLDEWLEWAARSRLTPFREAGAYDSETR